jgi:hypothetical protein
VAQYRDKTSRLHEVTISLVERRKIREQLGVDLVAAAHNPETLRNMLDRIATGEILWDMLAIIEGTTVDDLLACGDGSTEEAAGTALLQAIIDFFPQSSPLKEPLRGLVVKAAAAQEELQVQLESQLMVAVSDLDLRSALTASAALTSG